MKIGELADELGINTKTIRYYEEIGLLPRPDRDASGYRTYVDADVARLRFVKQAQQLDLRLDEIREILALRESGEVPCDYVREVAGRRLIELDVKIAEMLTARDELAGLLATADSPDGGHGEFCPLIERHRFADEERTPSGLHA